MPEHHKSNPLASKSYLWFAIVTIGLVAAFLLWILNGRIDDHQEYHRFIAMESAAGVADEVSRFVEERKRLVQLFANQHLDAIRAVASEPDSDEYYQRLSELINQYFPGHFAFTVASPDGIPYFEDFDGLVAESCRTDIKSFAEKQYYHPYIHPNYKSYHFDVMTNYGDREGVLFISFHADVLGAVIRAAQTPGHQLMLTYPAFNNLIEVVADGARNHLIRNDYRLSEQEQQRILINVPVTGTRWDAVDLRDPGLFADYNKKLYTEAAIIFSVFVIAAFIMVRRLRREELQRELAVRQRQDLMGVISHEFRTPASAIHGALELISRGTAGPINAETRRLVDLAESNTAQLLTLVNDFLDLQKYETGKLHMQMALCELRPIIDAAINNNQTYARHFGVTFLLNDNSVDVKLNCDARRIEQVLANLLSNAAKYGAKNDVIEILVTKPRESTVRVSVIDHGDGVAAHIQDKIFQKFVMARTAKRGKVRSSGLGLSISKAIIDEHGGNIGFNSEPGQGATFYFELPTVTN